MDELYLDESVKLTLNYRFDLPSLGNGLDPMVLLESLPVSLFFLLPPSSSILKKIMMPLALLGSVQHIHDEWLIIKIL